MKVVANATPLIALSLVDHLDLLPRLFAEVIIPQAVYEEARNAVSQLVEKGIRIHPRVITWFEKELVNF